jgi:hypothetical protein
VENTINQDLKSLSDWFLVNKLSLNVAKTNFIVFGTPQKLKNFKFNIKINNIRIEETDTVKYLGIIMDNILKWKQHINHIKGKISIFVGILCKIRHLFNMNTLRTIYMALVQSHLTYCVEVWGATYSSTLLSLFITQKKIIRVITGSDYLAHTEPLFKLLNILKFEDLYKYRVAILTYKLLHNYVDIPGIQITYLSHKYETKSNTANFLSRPKKKTNYGCFAFESKAPIIWNSIPSNIRSCNSLASFKKKLLDSLLDKY